MAHCESVGRFEGRSSSFVESFDKCRAPLDTGRSMDTGRRIESLIGKVGL